LELVEEEPGEYNAPMTTAATPPALTTASNREVFNRLAASRTQSDLTALGYPSPPEGKELRFNISRDTEARVSFHGPVTQEAIERLAALLELQKDTFPTKAELQPAREVEEEEE
jgi:hypothetical protein